MNKIITVAIVALLACTNEDGARRALEGAGYTRVTITGYRYTGCGDSDSTCTGFDAVGPTGRAVTGAVGCGRVFKGCTIRTD
jgi:hypothetical protein